MMSRTFMESSSLAGRRRSGRFHPPQGSTGGAFHSGNVFGQLMASSRIVLDANGGQHMMGDGPSLSMTALDQVHDFLPVAFNAGPGRCQTIRESAVVNDLQDFSQVLAQVQPATQRHNTQFY